MVRVRVLGFVVLCLCLWFAFCMSPISFTFQFCFLSAFATSTLSFLFMCHQKYKCNLFWLVEIFMGNQVFSRVHGESRDK
jgi:hypothetical protein